MASDSMTAIFTSGRMERSSEARICSHAGSVVTPFSQATMSHKFGLISTRAGRDGGKMCGPSAFASRHTAADKFPSADTTATWGELGGRMPAGAGLELMRIELHCDALGAGRAEEQISGSELHTK